MQKKNIQIILHFALVAIFISCVSETNESTQRQNELSEYAFRTDTLDQKPSECFLPDSLFALNQISSTSVFNDIEINYFDAYMFNNSDSIKLNRFNPEQVHSLILELPKFRVDSNKQEWIKGDWSIFFLSKQEKIADMQPIVLAISGTDYGGLFLLVLDKNCRPLSFTELTGGECDGSVYCPLFESQLNSELITTSEQRIIGLSSSTKLKIDSITYHKVILSNGKIELTKKDSTRVIKDRSEFDY